MATQVKHPFKIDFEYWMCLVLTHGPADIITLLDDVIAEAERQEEYEKAAAYLKVKKRIVKHTNK